MLRIMFSASASYEGHNLILLNKIMRGILIWTYPAEDKYQIQIKLERKCLLKTIVLGIHVRFPGCVYSIILIITIWTTIFVVFQSDKELTKPTNMLRNQQHAHWTQQRPTNINRWFSSKETVAGNLSIWWHIFRVKELGAPESWLEVGGFKTHLVPNKKVPFLYIAHLQLLGILETTLKPPRTFAAPCFTQTIVLRPKHLWSSHQLRNPKRPAPIYCVFQQNRWPQLSSEHSTALSPLGCHSSRSPPRHNVNGWCFIHPGLWAYQTWGDERQWWQCHLHKAFPTVGKRRTHMASWILIEWHPSKHLQEMYGDVVFFSKLASSRPKFAESVNCFRDQKHTTHTTPPIYSATTGAAPSCTKRLQGLVNPGTLQDILHPRED